MTPPTSKPGANRWVTPSAAADALGVTKTTYQAMERGRSFATDKPVAIDKRTALACAAISAGLQPWGATAADAPSTPS